MKRAEAISAEIAGAMAELEGECLGDPGVTAGKGISLGMAGAPFDGQYVCTSARHRFEPGNGGYSTWFTVGGRKDRSLHALSSGGAGGDLTMRGRVPGLAVGTVTDNKDPDSQGRVKVLFPWLSDTYVSTWARTMQIGAGKAGGFGCLFVPEVGDEVLVGFDRGDIDFPFVIGNLYNGVAKPEPAPQIDGAVASRRIMSRMKHMIQFDDGPSANGITITNGQKTVTIKLDSSQSAISITSSGDVTVQAGGAVNIESADKGMGIKTGGDLSIEAGGSISIEGVGMSMKSGGQLSLQGSGSISVEGQSVSVTAPSVSLGG